MKYAPYTLVTSIILLICATIIQSIQGYPSGVSVSFLLLGVSSVIHHSRQYEWWINDIWRLIDFLMVFIFAYFATLTFGDDIVWIIMCSIVIAITLALWTNFIQKQHRPIVHSLMHIIVCGVVMYLIQKKYNLLP